MENIEFKGKIVSGQGNHSNLVIPGKNKLSYAPEDWPDILYSGSLNVEVFINELPKDFDSLGPGNLIKKLDNGILKPAFVIKQNEIINNTIGPGGPVRGRGDAQVWRAEIIIFKTKQKFKCWVLRRLDSGMTRHLEIVSDVSLRHTLSLQDGDDVCVYLQGDKN